MNLYRVVSEELSVTIPILDDGTGPKEPYCIAELVVARNAKSAEWAAWKTDRESFTGDPRDKPNFQTKLLLKDIQATETGIVSEDPRFRDWWAEGGPGALDTARLDWLERNPCAFAGEPPEFRLLGPRYQFFEGRTIRDVIDQAMGEDAYRERLREEQKSSSHCAKAAP